MPFDFKKEQKQLYLPPCTPQLVEVPPMNYAAVEGQGDPNEEGGAYQQAIAILYAISYTLKMSERGPYRISGFFPYVVPPLEGFWRQEGGGPVDLSHKAGFHWISVIRLPDFISLADFEWAVSEAGRKKKLDCSQTKFLPLQEGLCVQMMHLGSYDSEPESLAQMDQYLAQQGYQNDFSDARLHHEIYLSDPRKTPPEKRKTVLRHPIKALPPQ